MTEENFNKETENIFTVMDNMAGAVEIFTGFKQQFIAAGWSPEVAEQMVVEILRSANIENSKGV